MNIRKELEKGHSKAHANKIVKFIGSDKRRFEQLVTVFLEGPYRITQRAAWPLSYCVQSFPRLIDPHLTHIIRCIKKPGIHEAVKRNTMRLLQFIDIPVRLHSSVSSLCFEYLSDKKEPIAIRVFSMTVAAKIIREYPDLKNDLIFLIEDEMPYGSAAFRSRGRKVLKQLSGN